jgi:hypothetical protein
MALAITFAFSGLVRRKLQQIADGPFPVRPGRADGVKVSNAIALLLAIFLVTPRRYGLLFPGPSRRWPVQWARFALSAEWFLLMRD